MRKGKRGDLEAKALGSKRSAKGRARASRKYAKLRLLLRVALPVVAIGACGLGILLAYAALTLPPLSGIGQATGTIRILDRNGSEIAEVGYDAHPVTTVQINQIAPLLQEATISAEDRNFYKEGAFDVPRIVKAVVIDAVLRRPAQGASTITQQLAKQAFFGPNAEKSPLRKVREALLANEIDSTYSKQQVLEKYLNLIYYGEDAYGIENASERFFGKHASDLNLREATLLAGLPNAPSADDPYQNPQGAYARMSYVLSSMVATKNISQAQADAVDPLNRSATTALQNQKAVLADLKNGHADLIGPAPHFSQYVQNQLGQIFADDPTVLSGTLTVTTTLDLADQQKANSAVDKGLPKLGPSANNAALLMLDSHTGDILAMVGSADFTNDQIAGQYNIVTALRRPGSSFKPYVYEEAFRTGTIAPGTTLNDTAAEAAQVGGTHDWDNQYMGDMSAAKALLLSRNVPAEQAMLKVGIPQVIDFAHQMGITSNLSPNVSTAIGASDVTMIDHASAYSAFSNGGHKVVARAILKVVDENGNVLLDNTQPPNQGDVMTPAEAYTITNILVHYPSVWGVHFNMPVAAKSGTTDNTVDAYYMSYTSDVVVAAWAGHTESARPEEIPMDHVYGTYVGQFISAPFMNSLGLPNKPFTPVPGAVGDCGTTDPGSFPAIDFGCPTPTPAPTPSPTPTPSPIGSPCASPTPTISVLATPSNSPTSLVSLLPTATPTPTATMTPTPTPTC